MMNSREQIFELRRRMCLSIIGQDHVVDRLLLTLLCNGNALLEAFYFRKPVLVNRYSIFVADIEPKGAKVIAMDGYLTKDVVAKVQRIIDDEEYRNEMIDFNYEIGKAFFSYSVLRRQLRALITNITGQENL